MYILDTNVISELRKLRPHSAVLDWLRRQDPSDLFISVVTLAEVQRGVEITRKQNPVKAAEIERWLDQIGETYRILIMDGDTFRTWARLMHGRSQALTEDAMIAATALQHRLKVVTRDTKDFSVFDVTCINPFS